MNWEDLAVFGILAMGLGGTWLAVYLTLRVLNWNGKVRLFRDSWLVWLIWLASSFFTLLLIPHMFSFTNPLIYFGILLVINTLLVGATLCIGSNPEGRLGIFNDEGSGKVNRFGPRIWKTAFLVNVGAIATTIAVIGLVTAGEFLIQKIYPNPKELFEIYD